MSDVYIKAESDWKGGLKVRRTMSGTHVSRERYADLFLQFSTPFEKWLKRVTVVFLVAVIVFQALLLWSDFREAATAVDRYEGAVDP